MNDKYDELNEAAEARPWRSYVRVSSGSQDRGVVSYLRVSSRGAERATTLAEQRDMVQRFAADSGYLVIRRYMEGDVADGDEVLCFG